MSVKSQPKIQNQLREQNSQSCQNTRVSTLNGQKSILERDFREISGLLMLYGLTSLYISKRASV